MRHDLHLHTVESRDNVALIPPEDLVNEADRLGLDYIGITDHNTLAGARKALSVEPRSVRIVPGVEVACEKPGVYSFHAIFHVPQRRLEALENSEFLQRMREDDEGKNREYVEQLLEAGVFESGDVAEAARREISEIAYCRQHTLSVIIDRDPDMKQRFLDYCAEHGVRPNENDVDFLELRRMINELDMFPQPKATPQEFARIAIEFGGVPLIAHPGRRRDFRLKTGDGSRDMTYEEKKTELKELFGMGFGGIHVVPIETRIEKAEGNPKKMDIARREDEEERAWVKAAHEVTQELGAKPPIIITGSDSHKSIKYLVKPKHNITQ